MTLPALLLQPLGPAAILALGGLLLALGHRFGMAAALRPGVYAGRRTDPESWKPLVLRLCAPAALLIIAAAAALLLLMRTSLEQRTIGWTWQPLTVAGSTLDWRLDGWSWLMALLVLLLAAAAVLLEGCEPGDPPAENSGQPGWRPVFMCQGAGTWQTLWLAAAVIVFISSGNVLTLAGSWLALDAVVAVRLRPGAAAQPAGRVWGLLSLGGALLLLLLTVLGESRIRTALADPSLRPLELALLWAAALVRAGIYPLHFWLSGPRVRSLGGQVGLSLIAPAAGLWMLGRVSAGVGADWLRRPEWLAAGALALLGTAIVAWAAEDAIWRWRWIALNRANVVVLAAYALSPAGPEALAWPVLTFVLGSGLLAVGLAVRERYGWAAAAWPAALVLWGLPGTAGFLGRRALVFPTESAVAVPLFALVAISEVLLVAALWETVRPRGARAARPHGRRAQAVGMGLAGLLLLTPALAAGLAPQRLAWLAGWAPGEAFPDLQSLLAGTRRSTWVTLGLSGVLGAGLGLLRLQVFGSMRGWQRGLSQVASLEWLYRAGGAVLGVAARGLQYFSRLGEGEGYLGWLALAAVILWALLRG